MTKRQRDQAARRLVKQALGTFYRITLLNRGVHNDIYLVARAGRKFVLRLGHPDFFTAYRQADEAMAAARQNGLPAPEVILCGQELIPRSYLLTSYVDGIPGDEYDGDQLKLWEAIGQLAEQINRIRTKGYGQHLFHQIKGEETWRQFIVPNIRAQLGFYSDWRGFDRAARKPFFSPVELAAIERHLEPLRGLRLKPRLIHVDLAPRNILVDSNGQITCVIDWDSAKSFPAPHQMAVSTFWLSPAEIRAFKAGYGRSFDPRLVRSFQIFEFLTQIPYYHKQPRLARTARDIIRHLLDSPPARSKRAPGLLTQRIKALEA